jgi:hypothetical protein
MKNVCRGLVGAALLFPALCRGGTTCYVGERPEPATGEPVAYQRVPAVQSPRSCVWALIEFVQRGLLFIIR